MSLHFFAAHKVVTAVSAVVVGGVAWLGTAVVQAAGQWPINVAGWVSLIVSLSVLVGVIIAYIKTYVLFRQSIAVGFEKLDERIGLAKGQTVIGVIDGQGKRIDAVVKTLNDINGLPESVRVLKREHELFIEQIKAQHIEIKACMEETRKSTKEAGDLLHSIDKRLSIIETTLEGSGGFKHVRAGDKK